MARAKVVEAPLALLVTAEEASDLCRVDVGTWWRWDALGRVPAAVRLGGCTRWKRADLERWVTAGCPDREQFNQQAVSPS